MTIVRSGFRHFDTLEIQVGSVLSLVCTFHGYPAPSVRWYMNGTKLERHVMTGRWKSIVVVNTTLHRTSYQCFTVDRFRVDSKSILITGVYRKIMKCAVLSIYSITSELQNSLGNGFIIILKYS